jgi:hypothetical protein
LLGIGLLCVAGYSLRRSVRTATANAATWWNQFTCARLCGLAFALNLAIALAAPAASIGINFSGGDATLPPTASAGVVLQQNWNNESLLRGGPAVLVDSSGATVPSTITWGAQFGGSTGDSLYAGPNNVLLNNYLNGFIQAGTSSSLAGLTVTDISYSAYDLYIYTEHSGVDDRSSDPASYRVNSSYLRVLTAGAGFYHANGFVLDTSTTVGDYLVFTALTGSTLYVEAGGLSLFKDSPINGVQIVEVPEPSAVLQALLGALGLLAVFMKSSHRRSIPGLAMSRTTIVSNTILKAIAPMACVCICLVVSPCRAGVIFDSSSGTYNGDSYASTSSWLSTDTNFCFRNSARVL